MIASARAPDDLAHPLQKLHQVPGDVNSLYSLRSKKQKDYTHFCHIRSFIPLFNKAIDRESKLKNSSHLKFQRDQQNTTTFHYCKSFLL